MKALKIIAENAGLVEASLNTVNGTAHRHSYTSYAEIEKLAEKAELKALGLLKANNAVVGARFTAISGDRVANSYQKIARTRKATKIMLVRKTAGWYLEDVQQCDIYQSGGRLVLILTKDQADRAHRMLALEFVTADELSAIAA